MSNIDPIIIPKQKINNKKYDISSSTKSNHAISKINTNEDISNSQQPVNTPKYVEFDLDDLYIPKLELETYNIGTEKEITTLEDKITKIVDTKGKLSLNDIINQKEFPKDNIIELLFQSTPEENKEMAKLLNELGINIEASQISYIDNTISSTTTIELKNGVKIVLNEDKTINNIYFYENEEISIYNFNENNQLESVFLSDQTKIIFNNLGNLSKVILPDGSEARYQYGQITRLINSDGKVISYKFDKKDQVTTYKDLNDLKDYPVLKYTDENGVLTYEIPALNVQAKLKRGTFSHLNSLGNYLEIVSNATEPTYNIHFPKYLANTQDENVHLDGFQKEYFNSSDLTNFIAKNLYYYNDIRKNYNNYTDYFQKQIKKECDSINFVYVEGEKDWRAYYNQKDTSIYIDTNFNKKHYEYVVGTPTHELGHAFDYSLNKISQSDEWNIIYEQIKQADPNNLLMREYAHSNSQECFADAIGEYFLENDSKGYSKDDIKAIEIDYNGYTNLYDYIDDLVNGRNIGE